jgi:hypothetical protein
MIVIEDRFAGVEITDNDIDQMEVVRRSHQPY